MDEDDKVFPTSGSRANASDSAETSADSENMPGNSTSAKVVRLLYVDLCPASVCCGIVAVSMVCLSSLS